MNTSKRLWRPSEFTYPSGGFESGLAPADVPCDLVIEELDDLEAGGLPSTCICIADYSCRTPSVTVTG